MDAMVSQITSLTIVYSTVQALIKETSKLHITGHCAGNSQVTSECPAQMASNMEMFPFDNIIMKIIIHSKVFFLELI